jgi:hypothetical protein
MARRRTITIVSGEDLTGDQYADRGNGAWGVLKIGHPGGGFHPGSDGLTTVEFLNDRRARHGGQCPWR